MENKNTEKATLTKVIEYRGDSDSIRSESVSFKFNKTELTYDISEGSPEDMCFGRDLEHTDSIIKMIDLAHRLGKRNVDIEFTKKEERY